MHGAVEALDLVDGQLAGLLVDVGGGAEHDAVTHVLEHGDADGLALVVVVHHGAERLGGAGHLVGGLDVQGEGHVGLGLVLVGREGLHAREAHAALRHAHLHGAHLAERVVGQRVGLGEQAVDQVDRPQQRVEHGLGGLGGLDEGDVGVVLPVGDILGVGLTGGVGTRAFSLRCGGVPVACARSVRPNLAGHGRFVLEFRAALGAQVPVSPLGFGLGLRLGRAQPRSRAARALALAGALVARARVLAGALVTRVLALASALVARALAGALVARSLACGLHVAVGGLRFVLVGLFHNHALAKGENVGEGLRAACLQGADGYEAAQAARKQGLLLACLEQGVCAATLGDFNQLASQRGVAAVELHGCVQS